MLYTLPSCFQQGSMNTLYGYSLWSELCSLQSCNIVQVTDNSPSFYFSLITTTMRTLIRRRAARQPLVLPSATAETVFTWSRCFRFVKHDIMLWVQLPTGREKRPLRHPWKVLGSDVSNFTTPRFKTAALLSLLFIASPAAGPAGGGGGGEQWGLLFLFSTATSGINTQSFATLSSKIVPYWQHWKVHTGIL